MKTYTNSDSKSNSGPPARIFPALLLGAVAAALCVIPATSHCQIFVANFGNGTIGEYNATTGATINSALVSGLDGAEGLASFGGNLFVANVDGNTVGEYTTSGATVNSAFISSSGGPYGLAFSGRSDRH
jgi:hypothetical protein